MKLYDFSAFAERREAKRREQEASLAVVEVISRIEEPGSIRLLKERVGGWFALHRALLKKTG